MQAQEHVQQRSSSTKTFSNPATLELVGKYRSIAALNHSAALLGWDLEVNMPESGAQARGIAAAEMELMTQTKTLELSSLVETADKEKDLNDSERVL